MKPVKLHGTVQKYSGKGRKLGYPTANIPAYSDAKDGVYFGYATLGKYKNHPAIIFIGTPTTVGDIDRRVEAHLLDIEDKDYYGRDISVIPRIYHRPNQTFASVDKLKLQMKLDEEAARDWFVNEGELHDQS